MQYDFQHIGIWGMGLLGGSLGLGLKQRGYTGRIAGIGRNPARLQRALELNACDEVYTDAAEILPQLDLLVLCVPVDTMRALLAPYVDTLSDNLTLTDVGSTKGRLVEELDALLEGHEAAFVGSHPMAGSEKSGIEESTPHLYEGATVVVTPNQDHPTATERIERLWRELGGRVVRMTPEAHDRTTAITSHVPHLASALVAALYGAHHEEPLPYREVVGNGFLDTTRIAAGDAVMWRDIVMHNRKEIAAGLRELGGELQRLLERIEAGDHAAIEAILRSAAEVRRSLDGET